MWEFNRAERRALAAGLCLVGLATVGRSIAGPGPGDFAWRAEGEPEAGLPGAGSRGELRSAVEEALAREERALTPLAPGERIDPGVAPPEELRRLPGVGPALARAIVEERARRPFGRVEDLLRVPGIGPVTLSRIEGHLTVEQRGRVERRGPPPRRAARAGGAPAPAEARAGGCRAGAVDVDRADEPRLRSLPGIGEARARRIVEHRGRHGPFSSLDALAEVAGIGSRTVERLRGLACASGRPVG